MLSTASQATRGLLMDQSSAPTGTTSNAACSKIPPHDATSRQRSPAALAAFRLVGRAPRAPAQRSAAAPVVPAAMTTRLASSRPGSRDPGQGGSAGGWLLKLGACCSVASPALDCGLPAAMTGGRDGRNDGVRGRNDRERLAELIRPKKATTPQNTQSSAAILRAAPP